MYRNLHRFTHTSLQQCLLFCLTFFSRLFFFVLFLCQFFFVLPSFHISTALHDAHILPRTEQHVSLILSFILVFSYIFKYVLPSLQILCFTMVLHLHSRVCLITLSERGGWVVGVCVCVVVFCFFSKPFSTLTDYRINLLHFVSVDINFCGYIPYVSVGCFFFIENEKRCSNGGVLHVYFVFIISP